MPGTSPGYPREVLPSLERPRPARWPQEVSNCLSLPPGNRAGQAELGSAGPTDVEGAFLQATDGAILRETGVHPPPRRSRQRADRPSSSPSPSFPLHWESLRPHLFQVYSFPIHSASLDKGPSVSPQHCGKGTRQGVQHISSAPWQRA